MMQLRDTTRPAAARRITKKALCLQYFVLLSWMVARAVAQAPATDARSSAPADPGEFPVRFERSLDAMGTTYTVALYGKDRFSLESATDEAFEEVKRLDEMLSNYRPESEWSKVNREAYQRPVPVPEELFRLLQRCLEYSRRSEGTFDITVGPLMKIWGFYKGSGRIPHRAEIRAAQSRMGWQYIRLDESARTVRFTRALEMDPGGIGKGYAVDRMVAILRERGVKSGIITAGRPVSTPSARRPPNRAAGASTSQIPATSERPSRSIS